MRKIFLPVIIIFLSAQFSQAQEPCNCNPDGWKVFSFSIGTNSESVFCGHRFTLDCTEPVTMQGLYVCSNNCIPKFTAIVKNMATGKVIENYSSFLFPWNYKFPEAGKYSLEITALCENKKCSPCIFYFTVTCPRNKTICTCDPNGWQKATITVGNGKAAIYDCAYWVSAKRNELIKLTTQFKCKEACAPTYTASIRRLSDNKVIQTFSRLSFPWQYHFSEAGKYSLIITPVCGDQRCVECNYFFAVK